MGYYSPHDTCLYLFPEDEVAVKLDENSLTVWQENILIGRYPIRRISFVCSNQLVAWQTLAVYALLENGIHLHFIGDENLVLGKLLPRISGENSYHYWLERFVNYPDWKVMMENYKLSRRYSSLKLALKKKGVWLNSLDSHEINLWIEESYRKVDSRGRHHEDYALFESIMSAKVEQQLIVRFLDRQQSKWVNFDLDIGDAVMCGVSYWLHMQLQRWYSVTPVGDRSKISFLKYVHDSTEKKIYSLVERELEYFFVWIRKVLD